MFGLEKGKLGFSEYDAQWPARFEQERLRIRETLGKHCGQVWHMGSTAVPGLMAKPVIDIAMDYADANQLWHIVEGMEYTLGYQFKNCHHEANHWYLKYEEDRKHLFHVHLWLAGSQGLLDHLKFVDNLRNNPELRDEYAQKKHAWAEVSEWDKMKYSECKGDFVKKVLAWKQG